MNQPQPQQNIDLSLAEDIICNACGNYSFQHVFIMKKISAILSPTGRAGVTPVPTFACNACGFINQEFLPVLQNAGPGESDTEQDNSSITQESGKIIS